MEKLVKLRAKYQNASDHKIVYSNGVTGGVGLKNEMILIFYTETLDPPESQSYAIEGDLITDQIEDDLLPAKEPGILGVTRTVTTTMILSLDAARELRDFLETRIKKEEEFEEVHEVNEADSMDPIQITVEK